MKPNSRALQIFVWGFLILVTLGVVALNWFKPAAPPAPLPVLGTVSTFALTDQSGRAFSSETLRGHVWVANVIFSRCGGPCPHLSRQLSEIQAAFPAPAPVRFLSLTSDPEFDTPPVLRKYGERFLADPDRWFFLTGAKKDVYRVAIEDLKFTVIDNQEKRTPEEDLFIHSTRFVVVDHAGRIRAYLDGGEPESVPRVVAVVKTLQKEIQSP